ncbi:amidohydrolase [bacterium]|nr:MAG: amidohydrolase [bacterium]
MIDAHHHFWRYNRDEYDWISDDMAALRRDFGPADLKKQIDGAGVKGVVSVQARQSVQETRELLWFAQQNEWILGVVGWVPLATHKIESVLSEFAGAEKLKAVRHVVQGETDGFLDGTAFNAGIARLADFGLVYDVLISERQLAEAIRFVDRHPNQLFVLDHIAKPCIKDDTLEPWKTRIGELARRDNVWCKVSGMVTEADWKEWTPDGLKPYFETVLQAFGPSRLMFGSDWPVCLVASEYGRWVDTVRAWAEPLSDAEKFNLFENVARHVYRLNS